MELPDPGREVVLTLATVLFFVLLFAIVVWAGAKGWSRESGRALRRENENLKDGLKSFMRAVDRQDDLVTRLYDLALLARETDPVLSQQVLLEIQDYRRKRRELAQ